jgi:hypothetical protein
MLQQVRASTRSNSAGMVAGVGFRAGKLHSKWIKTAAGVTERLYDS